MTLRVYNTLTRKKEVFKPIQSGKVKMYVCGPTVYDFCHIGHARSAIVFDVIMKYLKNIGFEVTYIRNFTDIDDKIIKRAKELNISCNELSQKYINAFHRDMESLNVSPATAEPRVTHHIKDIIQTVDFLIENKFAYEIMGNVYFSIDMVNTYGKFFDHDRKKLLTGSRIKVDKRKQNPLDFALWKSAKTGEPSWQSPWGKGRPGWHIECSVMNNKFLGKTIDIHGGGEDLIFPHHENEIIQSESAYNAPLARYWIHNGLVNINNEKMSKSLGNWELIKKIVQLYHPETIRLFILSNHYRSPLDFSYQNLDSYEKALSKAYRTLQRISKLKEIKEYNNSKIGLLWDKFCLAMNDDFNTAKCIGILFNAVKKINKAIDQEFNMKFHPSFISDINDILRIGKILGILNLSPENYLRTKNNTMLLKKKRIDSFSVENLIKERKKAKKNKDWKKADAIRNQLNAQGIKIEDRIEGTIWRIIN